MPHRIARLRALAGFTLLAFVTQARAEFSFLAIPELGGNIVKLSADGTTLVGTTSEGSLHLAAFWTVGTGTVRLGTLPGGLNSQAYDVSADGKVIVGRSESANGAEAFIWTPEGGMSALGDLPGGGPFNSTALGVSADGRVVVGQSSSASLQRAFRWSRASGMTDLGSLGLGFSSATAANADGTVIVGSSRSTDSQEAFRWTAAEGMTGLGALPSGGWTQRANAVTPDGRVIVGVGAISSFEAFRWTATEVQLLGTFAPTNPGSSASDVSADGNVIVGMGSGVDADGSGEAFVWFPRRGILDLRRYLLDHGVSAVQSWRLSEAMSVSADGRTLAGWGIDPQGRASAWIARIDIDDAAPPAPLIPAAPTNLIATAAATRVTLQWLDRAGNETGFKVERCAGSNCIQFVEIGQVAANVRSFIDVGVARNSVYRYRVRAFNAAGNSSYSNVVTVRTLRK